MNTNTDLTYSKANRLIKNAFLELLDEIDFEKISVTTITQRAKLSRTTFYLYFQDKYDLLEQIEDEILHGLNEISSQINFDDLIKNGFSSDMSQYLLLNVYEYIKVNHQFFKTVLCNNSDPYFYYKLSKTLKVLCEKNITEGRFIIPKNYAVSFVIGVHTSFIAEWIKSGMKESPEELVLMISKLLNNLPKTLLE